MFLLPEWPQVTSVKVQFPKVRDKEGQPLQTHLLGYDAQFDVSDGYQICISRYLPLQEIGIEVLVAFIA